jgi:dTDP-4-dehydrorhamnose reductase
VKEVAQNMEKVIMLPGGAYNFGSETEKSMYELTKDFLKLLGKNVQVEDSLPRHNLWMNCQKARKFGVTFQSVEEALKTCAKDYGFLE